MADLLTSAPFIYPMGSFYQDLDSRLKSIEAILGTSPGTVPDNSVTQFKIADGAVSTRALGTGVVTGDKLDLNAVSANTAALPEAIFVDDVDMFQGNDPATGKGFKYSLTTLLSSIFKPARLLKNLLVESASFAWQTSTGAKWNWDDVDVTTGRQIQVTGLPVNFERHTVQPITLSTSTIIPIALGSAPDAIEFRLINVTADNGYNPGDVLYRTAMQQVAAGATAYGAAFYWTPGAPNQVTVRMNPAAFSFINPSTFAVVNLTPANWKLELLMWWY